MGSAVRELFLELVDHVHVDYPLSREPFFSTLIKCYLVVRVPSKQCLWALNATTAEAKGTEPTSTKTLAMTFANHSTTTVLLTNPSNTPKH